MPSPSPTAEIFASNTVDDSRMALASVYNCFAKALIEAAPSALIAYLAIPDFPLNTMISRITYGSSFDIQGGLGSPNRIFQQQQTADQILLK